MPSCRGWGEAASRPGWEPALHAVTAAVRQRGCHGSLPSVAGVAPPDVQRRPLAADSQEKAEAIAPTLMSLHITEDFFQVFGFLRGLPVSFRFVLPSQGSLRESISISNEWMPQKQCSACGVSRDALLTPVRGAGPACNIHQRTRESPPCKHTCHATAREASVISADLHGQH